MNLSKLYDKKFLKSAFFVNLYFVNIAGIASSIIVTFIILISCNFLIFYLRNSHR
jgi:hypothetical protein